VGSKEFIEEARIWRKRFGGGMRQAGIIAAAGLIALEESPKRLHEDHENAKRLAEGIAQIPGIAIDVAGVETNIVIFDVACTGRSSAEIVADLRERGILSIGFGTKIRFVTHCDVSAEDITKSIVALASVV